MSFNNRHNFLNKSLAHLLLGLFWLLLLLYFLISFYLCTEKLLIFESQSCIQEHFCSLINKSLWMSFDFFLHSIILPEHKVFAAFIIFFYTFSPLSCLIVRTPSITCIPLDLTFIIISLFTLIRLLLKFYYLLWSLP